MNPEHQTLLATPTFSATIIQMPPPAPASVFISYSHQDKRIARRVVRRFTAHGIKTWLDEEQLRFGSALSTTIRTHIESADIVIVIATNAAAASKWVAMELKFATDCGKNIAPLLVELVAEHELFRNHLGVDATLPQNFEEVLHRLMGQLYAQAGLELPPPDRAALITALRDFATEEPDLAPLIKGSLDSDGLHGSNTNATFESPFHPLDFTLNALFDVKPDETMATHAAYGFNRAGAGTTALSSWIGATGDGGLPLVTALGTELAPGLIWSAIQLLGECDPPNNHALYQFIARNAAQLSEEQKRATIRLVTWPVRTDTGRLGDVLGWVAMRHFPRQIELLQMWTGWVHKGCFDGKPNSPRDLARYLADAHKEELVGWNDVSEALRSHVRGHLRSRDKDRVTIAIDHIQAAADAKSPVLKTLTYEADGVTGSAEWKDWAESDKEMSEFMGWYLFHVVEQAAGKRDWGQALQDAERMVEFQKKRWRILAGE